MKTQVVCVLMGLFDVSVASSLFNVKLSQGKIRSAIATREEGATKSD